MSKVLLVDDDVMVRGVLRTCLERAGHQVCEAANGVEGLEVVDAEQPAVVVTDILMPRMNGLEMLVELRKRRPETPLIAMTGSSSPDDADAMLLLARDLGAARTFRKPLDLAALLRAVSELTGE